MSQDYRAIYHNFNPKSTQQAWSIALWIGFMVMKQQHCTIWCKEICVSSNESTTLYINVKKYVFLVTRRQHCTSMIRNVGFTVLRQQRCTMMKRNVGFAVMNRQPITTMWRNVLGLTVTRRLTMCDNFLLNGN